MPEGLGKIAERLRSVQDAAQEQAASFEERDDEANADVSGSREEGKRWDELQAGTEQLAKMIGEAADEADELRDTYSAELG